uniref:Uncharacterized protein n=1 Tax=Strigamia maritima TaxID=126957 RepID=T1IX82_STRMM
MGGIDIDWLKKPIGILQGLAWLFSAVSLGLYCSWGGGSGGGGDGSGAYYGHVFHVTVDGTFFVLLYYIIAYLLKEKDAEEYGVTVMIFIIVHAILNVIAGAMILGYQYNTGGRFYAMGVMCILVFVALLIWGILLFKNK